MHNSPIQRRAFLRRVGAGAAGVAAIGSPGVLGGYPANERINIGAIGTGGRCTRALLPAVKSIDGIEVVAVCDVWDPAIERAKALATPGAVHTRYYERILERSDIDAVIVATSDHWHSPITIDACKAGKDVYVEKPLTHKASEGAKVVAAQNKYKRIVQVGMQQRSMPQFKKAYEVIRSGRLGKIHKVHLTWNRNSKLRPHRYGVSENSVDWERFLGNAPKQPFNEYRLRNFRWFWDFGGGILTDLMVHYIDVAHWFLDLQEPDTAMAIGDHFQADHWETPDTMQTLIHYPKQRVQVYFEGTFSNARNRAMLEFMGTDATLYLDRGRYEVHPEHKDGKYEEYSPGVDVRGADFDRNVAGGLYHLQNWIECMKTREKPAAPAEVGALACTGAHLGNYAYRSGKVAHWSDIAT
ncbi:MAG: Gfo/Idh/MocA family oxidoreductase [Planctomycetes bacterium]|nr:Gfo/Idh/MocA family oxidoreductase [Planctomycetota bacterium]